MARNGIKLGVVAMEASGKTTLISKLEDALVVSTDNKAFTGKVPHFRYSTYDGLEHLTSTIEEKVGAYNEKMGKLPKTLVIDSVTHLANNMEKYWNRNAKGFDVWANFGKDIMEFNAFLEDVIIPEGINVIFTAHCQYDQNTMKYTINAPGNFGKNGSWLSVTDNAIFIEIKGNKRIVHNNTPKFPCRSNVLGIEDSVEMDSYDINEHVTKLEGQATDSVEWEL